MNDRPDRHDCPKNGNKTRPRPRDGSRSTSTKSSSRFSDRLSVSAHRRVATAVLRLACARSTTRRLWCGSTPVPFQPTNYANEGGENPTNSTHCFADKRPQPAIWQEIQSASDSAGAKCSQLFCLNYHFASPGSPRETILKLAACALPHPQAPQLYRREAHLDTLLETHATIIGNSNHPAAEVQRFDQFCFHVTKSRTQHKRFPAACRSPAREIP